MKRGIMVLAVSMGLCLMISTPQAALFTNGSFENPTGTVVGNFLTLGTGSTAITGWTVTSGSIDWVQAYWEPSDGLRSIDLAGDSPGGISQIFDTVTGATYRVNFDLAGNPDNPSDPVKVALAFAADGGGWIDGVVESFNTAGNSRSAMGWESRHFDFIALSNQTTLTFSSFFYPGVNNDLAYGVAIDDVSVNIAPVPEPGTMLLLGSGLVGLAGWGRKKFRK